MNRAWAALSRFWAEHTEYTDRMALMERPWLEEVLHWSWEDGEWVLHGTRLPRRGESPTTAAGWCLRRAAHYGQPSRHHSRP